MRFHPPSVPQRLAAILAAALCLVSSAAQAQTPDPELAKAIAGPWRDPANVARDAAVHPLELLTFFGVQPNMSVVEVGPGKGYWTEILAPYLRDKGLYTVALANPDTPDSDAVINSSLMNGLHAEPMRFNIPGHGNSAALTYSALSDKLAKDEFTYAKVRKVYFDRDHPFSGLNSRGGLNSRVDMMLTFGNSHDWFRQRWFATAFKVFRRYLKPGGILGIVDYRAPHGQPQDSRAASGYVSQEYVIGVAQAEGFEFVGGSELEANPKDTKNWAAGAWTLPPTYALGDQDRDKYADIGEPDQFVLKFRRPLD